MRQRRLLILAALGCIAPVSAAQAPAYAEPIWHSSDCPYARAEMAAAQREAASGTAVRWAESSSAAVSIFNVSRGAPALVP